MPEAQGFRICDGSERPEWVMEARALARSQLEEWRIPGTENIVARSPATSPKRSVRLSTQNHVTSEAVLSYELHYSALSG